MYVRACVVRGLYVYVYVYVYAYAYVHVAVRTRCIWCVHATCTWKWDAHEHGHGVRAALEEGALERGRRRRWCGGDATAGVRGRRRGLVRGPRVHTPVRGAAAGQRSWEVIKEGASSAG